MSAQRARTRVLALFAALALAGAGLAHADWLAPDATLRDALIQVRFAQKDTTGHAEDPARLDTLGVALLRVGRLSDARTAFERVRLLAPGDRTAAAGLGKLALFAGQLARAESLLTEAGDAEGAAADRYALALRRHDWKAAAAQCAEQGEEGRQPLFERLAEGPEMTAAGERTEIYFERTWPAPLVKVRLNGTTVLMMVDTGTEELLLDKSAMAVSRALPVGGQHLATWGGTRVAVRHALVQKLQIGDLTFTNVPAHVLSLHKFSIEVNPQAQPIAGVIGLSLLRHHDVSFDYARRRLTFEPLGSATKRVGERVPFEEWGAGELHVWGSMNGGRRMAFMLATGMPGGGVGAPDVVFEELGVRPGGVAKLAKGAGAFLQGKPWSAVSVSSLTLGRAVYDKQPAWSGAMEAVEMWRHGVRRDGLLGPGILQGRNTTIDWTRRELVVEDN